MCDEWSEGDSLIDERVIDEKGFTFADLMPGSYRLIILDAPKTSDFQPLFELREAFTDRVVPVKVANARPIYVRVVDARGMPIWGVQARVRRGGRRTVKDFVPPCIEPRTPTFSNDCGYFRGILSASYACGGVTSWKDLRLTYEGYLLGEFAPDSRVRSTTWYASIRLPGLGTVKLDLDELPEENEHILVVVMDTISKSEERKLLKALRNEEIILPGLEALPEEYHAQASEFHVASRSMFARR